MSNRHQKMALLLEKYYRLIDMDLQKEKGHRHHKALVIILLHSS